LGFLLAFGETFGVVLGVAAVARLFAKKIKGRRCRHGRSLKEQPVTRR
jgi:hypothetical protein